MKNKSFLSIVKKEFLTYVNSVQAYVVIVPFVLISHFLYFRTVFLIGDANMRSFVELLPWFLVVIAPALTMRVFAEEYRRETLELLFAHPISEAKVVLAKFLGVLSFYGLILLATAAIPITLLLFSKADVGLIFSQYVGALFIGAGFLAVGMATSVFVKQSVGSFLAGVAINFVLILIGLQFVALMFPGILGKVINEMAVMTHMTNLARGVVDFRDVLYFITLVGIFLAAGTYKLSERKFAESPKDKRLALVIMGLIVGIGVAGNVLMSEYPIRLDLTHNRQFSLAAGTKELLRTLPDKVAITLYTSRNLPSTMQVTLKETNDWIKDFTRYGKRVAYRAVYTDEDSQARNEALEKGIKEVQFNQIGSSSFAVQTGFLGLEVRFADKTETIPFIEDASNLEYQLSRMILTLTKEDKDKLGLLDVTEESGSVKLNSLLADQYEIINLSNDSTDTEVADLKALIVLDDGTAKNASAEALVKAFVANNGNVIALIDGVTVNQQVLSTTASISDMKNVFSDLGVEVSADLAYDRQLSEAISLPMGNMRVIVQYPFWVKSIVNPEAVPFGSQITSVLLGWPSTLTIQAKEKITVKPLLLTSKASGRQKDNFTINPNSPKDFEKLTYENQELPLGVVISKGEQRIAMIANRSWVSDQFLENSVDNQAFMANLTDWAVADPILASIPKRTATRNVFLFTSTNQALIVQYANLILPPCLIMLLGFLWLRRRRKLTLRQYTI